MEKNKRWQVVSCLIVMCVVTSCSSTNRSNEQTSQSHETNTIYEGDYAALLPFQPSDASQKHASTTNNEVDTFTIGNGLMELSKEHFSTKTHTFRGGVHLTYDILDATDGSSGLLGRASEDNPNGMNPAIGAIFPSKDGSEQALQAEDVLLLDIYELDWYKDNELTGLSLALVLNDKIGSVPNQHTLDQEKLTLYGEESARKLVQYLRKTVPAIGNNMGIFVTLYNASSVDETLPGSFFESAYFNSKVSGNFQAINDQWLLFPTSAAMELDGTNATFFDRYVASFKDFLSQDISIIAKGHFRDEHLIELKIYVTMHARSSDEVYAAIQLLNENIALFTNNNFKIMVDVMSDNTHVAVIERQNSSSETKAIMLV